MDLVGHVLLGTAITGQATVYTVACSLLPDVTALPFQIDRRYMRPNEYPRLLTAYRLAHGPMMMVLGYLLPAPAFELIAAHLVSDLLTHHRPFSDVDAYQWDYAKRSYWVLLITLGAITWIRMS